MDELTNNITTNTDYLKHHISDKNRVKILENNIGILNKLCSCLNPYKDITDEQKKLLEKFHIQAKNKFIGLKKTISSIMTF